MSLPRFFWRSTLRLNLVVGVTSSGRGGTEGGGSEALRLATSDTQIVKHLFRTLVVQQVLALPGLPEEPWQSRRLGRAPYQCEGSS